MKVVINVSRFDAEDCIWVELNRWGIDSITNKKKFLDAIRKHYNGCTEEVACYDSSNGLSGKVTELMNKYYTNY